jgi:hypothetical protein
MGRTFKEKPWKYKNDKNFQKKQKKHLKGQRPFNTPTNDVLGDNGQNPLFATDIPPYETLDFDPSN